MPATTHDPTFLTEPGPTPAEVNFPAQPAAGNLWIAANDRDGRVPVLLRTEDGDSLTATISVEGMRAIAAYVTEQFPERAR